VAWVVSGVFVLSAFAGGILWRQSKVNRAAAQVVELESSEEQWAEALRLFDEAVRARYEERAQGAMNAIAAARRADPQLRSVDVLVGEIALDQKDPETLRRAAEYALERGENESSANLLNALEVWMRRGEKGTDKAGQLAEQFLSDAADAEPSNAAVYFFHGELSRLLGDGRKAHRHLLSALHRQHPWRSAALLENKLQIAAREAADEGAAVMTAPPTEQAEVILALRSAVQSGYDTNEELVEFVRVTPTPQILDLVADSALGSSREAIGSEALRRQMDSSVPHSGMSSLGSAK
jgi:outer membrane murein-binding lipoprotein Lpp